MGRWFVYINWNSDKKHINIHPEDREPCNDIFRNVRRGGIYGEKYWIEWLDHYIIKTAERDNSCWLIIWADSIDRVKENVYLQEQSERLNVTPQYCRNCE